MRFLGDVIGLVDPAATVQSDLEKIERQAFQSRPTLVSGVDNTLQGPPTTGTWELGDLWTDALKAPWRCVTAGTPGAWRQLLPAIVTADPGGTLATNYRILRVDGATPRERVWDGAAWKERGLFGVAIAAQAAAIPDATGGATVDTEARAAINALLAAARLAGLIAP